MDYVSDNRNNIVANQKWGSGTEWDGNLDEFGNTCNEMSQTCSAKIRQTSSDFVTKNEDINGSLISTLGP